jgi:hypothetical protein
MGVVISQQASLAFQCPHRRARPGTYENKSLQREAQGSPINTHVAGRNHSLQRAVLSDASKLSAVTLRGDVDER